jgi:hypothetical protein
MVDVNLLQSFSYVAAAVGVCVAAVYYVINLRVQQDNMKETVKNRRATLTTNLMQFITNVERQKIAVELLAMQWKDFDDFYKKYDSTVNPDNYAKRITSWSFYEMLGIQYRAGLLDFDTMYAIAGLTAVNMWVHFKPIIEEYRKFDYGSDFYTNWEYLANEFARVKAQRDPTWKGSKSYIKSDRYDEVFKG